MNTNTLARSICIFQNSSSRRFSFVNSKAIVMGDKSLTFGGNFETKEVGVEFFIWYGIWERVEYLKDNYKGEFTRGMNGV